MQYSRQHNDMTVADYYKKITMVVKIVEKYGAEFATTARRGWFAQEIYGNPFTMLAKEQKDTSETHLNEQYLAIIFILNANKNKSS